MIFFIWYLRVRFTLYVTVHFTLYVKVRFIWYVRARFMWYVRVHYASFLLIVLIPVGNRCIPKKTVRIQNRWNFSIINWENNLDNFQKWYILHIWNIYLYRTQVYLGTDLWVLMSLTHSVTPTPFIDLTDVTLADEVSNSKQTNYVNRAILGNVAMQVAPSDGQHWN